ncbi:MAG: aspartate--tRNA ligase [Planctomycetota bacterium]|nr:aspartate--tRNA ligase [Planctomycetota bacterium]
MLLRSHTCGEIRESHVGQTITLNGWVNSYRDHGSLVFIDIRDRFGITQLVFDREDCAASVIDAATKLRNEDVIAVGGVVRLREGKPNPRLETGKVEVVVREIEVLNKTENPPFLPEDPTLDGNIKLPNEELRLKYRYMDLRRPRMQQILATRHKLYQVTRRYFDENGFLEIETPILYKSTPEGAREFLVPSRNVPGNFYALPQSPQLFKQILMVSGCDRYMQICRCFRDEDPRADRQAEFTQIDLEMSFVRREQVMQMMEGFIRRLWKEMVGFDVPPLQRMTYRDAMERFGIDRPDTRYGLEIKDISEIAAKTEVGFFKDALAKGADRPQFNSKRGVVKAIAVPGGAEKLTRKMTDGYTEFVKGFGAGGVAVVKVNAQGAFETGIAKFLEPVKAELTAALNLKPGDTVLFVADVYSTCTKALGELRQKVARDMGIVPKPGAEGGPWNFLWVVDFPMFEKDKESGRWIAMHHPFTAPRDDQAEAFVNADVNDEVTIEAIVSAGYDIVLNGQEIAGGSIRIHDQAVQGKVFQLLGLTPEQAKEKFSFLLEALSYGAPPHGGVAFGLDRLVMNFCGTDNIRDVIAFPKTQIGSDLMTRAPSPVTDAQLKDVHVKSLS